MCQLLRHHSDDNTDGSCSQHDGNDNSSLKQGSVLLVSDAALRIALGLGAWRSRGLEYAAAVGYRPRKEAALASSISHKIESWQKAVDDEGGGLSAYCGRWARAGGLAWRLRDIDDRGRDNNKESLVVCGRPGEVGGEDGQYRVERWGKNRNHRRRGHGRDSGHPAREGGVSKCQS